MIKHNCECTKEIGSEFYELQESLKAEHKDNIAYLLSGRTALRFIIDDICVNQEVRTALLPSYCCESMILPFVQAGINVHFYDVYFDHIDYPYENDSDIVVLIDFFGYTIGENSEIARCEKHAGKIIIYDSTHKIDGNFEVESFADYSFCSYRKWFYCNFAKAVKHNGAFCKQSNLYCNEHYISLRDEALYEKQKYIFGNSNDKESYQRKFALAEQILDNEYIGFAGNPVSFDIDEIITKRQENAKYLISQLITIPQINLWRKDVMQNDSPMFVPILLDPIIRDDLRHKLICEKIYCPIHWPESPYHAKRNEWQAMELSLVCDQRYDITDMERVVSVIKDFFEKY
ncbi:MAG: hypothetical protein IKJ07_01655 [Clostridia bacterium]|nr:hypothetical protein [Clostridia bacterium]